MQLDKDQSRSTSASLISLMGLESVHESHLIDCRLQVQQQAHLTAFLQLFSGIQTGAVAVKGPGWLQLPSA